MRKINSVKGKIDLSSSIIDIYVTDIINGDCTRNT
jgi:hypothetical protein